MERSWQLSVSLVQTVKGSLPDSVTMKVVLPPVLLKVRTVPSLVVTLSAGVNLPGPERYLFGEERRGGRSWFTAIWTPCHWPVL